MHFVRKKRLTAHIMDIKATGAYHQSQFLLSIGFPTCLSSSFSRSIATLSPVVSGMTSGAVLQEHSKNKKLNSINKYRRFMLVLLCCSC